MIIGAHSILYSRNAEADRAFLRDVLKLPHVDVGEGWLIFGLPPAEIAMHPADEGDTQALYLMCADIEAFAAAMARESLACTPRQNLGWGVLTELTLPSGAKVGVYEPRHARPKAVKVKGKKNKKAAKKAKDAAEKKSKKAKRAAKKEAPKKAQARPRKSVSK
jgi:hypothetical protein